MQLDGKVALVTGAASGIGRATAMRLATEGSQVVCADIDEEMCGQVVREAEAHGGNALCVGGDVARLAEVRAMVDAARQRYGGLDILVNNAGVVEALTTQRVAFPDIAPRRWIRMLDVNLKGVVLCTQYAIGAMRQRRGGAIVNISSGAGIGYVPHDAPVYAAAKAAVARFTAALGPLKDRDNIRVNCICPGWVNTPMVQRAREETPPETWEAVAPATMLQPEDIAEAVVSLLRDEARTGQIMLYLTPGEPWQFLPAAFGT